MKNKNQIKITHFHEPLKPILLKGRRIPLHLLDSVKTELNKLKHEEHIKKLENCDEDCFISPIFFFVKKTNLSSWLWNQSLLINKYTRTKNQMPKIHKLLDKVAAQIASDSVGEVWFTNLDLKNA